MKDLCVKNIFNILPYTKEIMKFLLLFISLFFDLPVESYNGEPGLISSDVAPETVVIYLSPLTTKADLDDLSVTLLKRNSGITINNAKFDNSGSLVSFEVSIKKACNDQQINYRSATDFTSSPFPLAAILLGTECSHGLISTKYRHMPMYIRYFLNDERADLAKYAWQGSFERIERYTSPH